MATLLNRLFTAFFPFTVEKKSDPIRFGILGAAKAAYVFTGPWAHLLRCAVFTALLTLNRPMTLITPAKSHPDVVLQAISARDRTRAEGFAKRHDIPDVRDSYQGGF
jgi:predicted dehydrogenase